METKQSEVIAVLLPEADATAQHQPRAATMIVRRADGQFNQTAALKIMAAHLAGPEFLRRFETKRQVLASLNHNVVDGRPLSDHGVRGRGDAAAVGVTLPGLAGDRGASGRRRRRDRRGARGGDSAP